MRAEKHAIAYPTGETGETTRMWSLAFNYIPGRPGTYFDPPENEEFEFLTATCGDLVLDFDDWIDECDLELDEVTDYASDALMYEDSPSDRRADYLRERSREVLS